MTPTTTRRLLIAGRRDLNLLGAGQLISTTGDAAALVALLLRLRSDGSGWVAGLMAAGFVPFVVLASVSGRVVDRVESRLVLLVALIGQGLVAVPLAFVSQPWATIALFTALSALSTFVRPATSAMVPAIVGPDDAPRGYARLATGSGLGWIIGPALGGVLTAAIGVGPTLLLDAGTFVGLSIAVAFIRARRPPHSAERSVHGSESDVRGSGLALLMRSPVLRVAIVTTAVSLGCAVVDNVAAPFRFINQLHTAESDYGLYLALWGIGSLLAVQLVAKLRSDQHPATLAVGNALVGLGIAGIGLAPNLTVALIASAAGGFGNGLVNVVESALVATHTPQAQHGRAFAASGAVMQSAIGVGTAAAAPLVAGFGAGHAMTLAGTLAAIAAVAGLAVVRTRGGNPKAMP